MNILNKKTSKKTSKIIETTIQQGGASFGIVRRLLFKKRDLKSVFAQIGK